MNREASDRKDHKQRQLKRSRRIISAAWFSVTTFGRSLFSGAYGKDNSSMAKSKYLPTSTKISRTPQNWKPPDQKRSSTSSKIKISRRLIPDIGLQILLCQLRPRRRTSRHETDRCTCSINIMPRANSQDECPGCGAQYCHPHQQLCAGSGLA